MLTPNEVGDVIIEQLCLLWQSSSTVRSASLILQANPSLPVNILGCMLVGGQTVALGADRPYSTSWIEILRIKMFT